MDKSKYIRALASVIDAQIDKYEYLLARYLNDTSVSIRNDWCYNNYFVSYGFDPVQDGDLQKSANINVIKSVIDTLLSNIADEKVRPYFTPNNSDYKTKKLVKQIQRYFDAVYDNVDIHSKTVLAFLSACIFGVGYIWINPFTYEIENLPTWTVGLLHTEELYSKEPTKMLVKMMNFPTTVLKQKYNVQSSKDYETVSIYLDTEEKSAELFVGTTSKKKIKLESSHLPIVEIRYTKGILGSKGRGIVEELDGIQTQIDLINAKISAAAQLTSANTTYVIEGSNLKPSDIDNRVGKVYGIKMPPGVSAPPVVNVTPVPFDPMWQKLLDYYIDQAYNIVGVNKLDAQAQKPAGLDSGVALQTMEDISSNRFQTQLQNFIRAYTDLAKKIIDIMPEDEEILPANQSSVKWKDIKKASDEFKVQYSAATALSKDPQERLKQIIQLSEMGLIGADKLATYLDSPDFSEALSGATAVTDAIENCIQLALDGVSFDIPEFINYQKLAEEITITQNQLFATETKDNKDDLSKMFDNLSKLEKNLMSIMEQNGFIDTTQEQQQLETSLGNITNQATQAAGSIADVIQPMDNTTGGDEQALENSIANGEVL